MGGGGGGGGEYVSTTLLKTGKFKHQNIKMFSLYVENLVTKVSDVDFVNCIKSFDLKRKRKEKEKKGDKNFTSALFDSARIFKTIVFFIPLL